MSHMTYIGTHLVGVVEEILTCMAAVVHAPYQYMILFTSRTATEDAALTEMGETI